MLRTGYQQSIKEPVNQQLTVNNNHDTPNILHKSEINYGFLKIHDSTRILSRKLMAANTAINKVLLPLRLVCNQH